MLVHLMIIVCGCLASVCMITIVVVSVDVFYHVVIKVLPSALSLEDSSK